MTDPLLILKRSELAHAGFEDFDVLSDGALVGRIYNGKNGDKPRFWETPRGHHAARRAAAPNRLADVATVPQA